MTDHRTPAGRGGLCRVRNAALGGVSLLALMLAGAPCEARNLNSIGAVGLTGAAQQAALAAAQQAAGAAAQSQLSLSRAAAELAAMRQLQQNAAAAGSTLSSPDGLGAGALMPQGGTSSNPYAGITSTNWVGGSNPVQTVNGSQYTVTITQNQQYGVFYWDSFNIGASTTLNFNQAASNYIALNRVSNSNSTAPSTILGHINAPGTVYIINGNGIIFGAGSQVNVGSLIASTLDVGALGTPLSARDLVFESGIAGPNAFSVYDPNEPNNAATTFIPGDVKVEPGASITATIVSSDSKTTSGYVYLFGANVYNSGYITAPTDEVALVAAREIDLVTGGYSVLPKIVGTFRGTEFRIEQFSSSYDPTTGAATGLNLSGTGTVAHDGLIEASRGIVVMDGDNISIDSLRTLAGDPTSSIITDAAGNPVQGVISVDTSVDRNSMVLLRAATSVTLNGVISSQPYDDTSTLPLLSASAANSGGNSVASFTPAYVDMSAQSSVTVGSSGLISAPSAQVTIRAVSLGTSPTLYQTDTSGNQLPGLFYPSFEVSASKGGAGADTGFTGNAQQVLLAPGATIDVAGLQNVQLPATYNFLGLASLENEFADMPLQRNGPFWDLKTPLWIDIRDSGTRSDGTSWVGTPLFDASGDISTQVLQGIAQLMTQGGTVNLATDLGKGSTGQPSSIQTAGSVINMAGGSIQFLPGMVPTTRLLGTDGRIYSMANANPNMTYVGIAGQFTVDHSHWNVSETWSTGTETYQPGYTEGENAGSLTVTTVEPLLQGTFYFGSVAGQRQISSGQSPSATPQVIGDQLPWQGSLTLTTPSSVVIGTSPSANFTTHSGVTTTLSADTLSGYGLSTLNITANDLVVSSGSTLNLAGGGSFSVAAGGAIDIAGSVYAADGAINLVTDRVNFQTGSINSILNVPIPQNFTNSESTTSSNLSFTSFFNPPTNSSGSVIAANVYVEGALDVSGRFVNDTGRFGADASGPGFINGGKISITTNKSSNDVKGQPDTTGSILLAKNSVLDVSSGGYISPQGKPKTTSAGVIAGTAGSISLVLYQGVKWNTPANGSDPITPSTGTVAVLELDGSLLGYGFASNGSLTLGGADTIRIGGSLQPGETSSIQIDGQPSVLPVALLTGGGFGSYTIESIPDGWSTNYTTTANITISAGVDLTLQQQNLSSTFNYSATATGTKLGQQASPALALLPDDQRSPVNLTLEADSILLDSNSKSGSARIVTDPKAVITFNGLNLTGNLALNDPTRVVPATSVTLLGTIVDHGGTVSINALKTYLGSKALVDLSGTLVANSRFGLPGGQATSGTYLPGGTFTVEAGTLTQVDTGATDSNNNNSSIYYYTYSPNSNFGTSYVVADAGATVDVSGAAGMIEVEGAHGTSSPVWSWSNAGTVSADVYGFAWGGSLVATGGRYVGSDGQTYAGNGGTLIVGGNNIGLRKDTSDVITAVDAFDSAAKTSPTSISLAADQLAAFDNIFLYSAAVEGGAARFFNELTPYNRLSGTNVVAQTDELPGSIYGIGAPGSYGSLVITGSLNWNVASGLRIAAGTINSPSALSMVTLNAPYVLLTGGGGTAAAGTNTLNINAQTIDIEGATFSSFGEVGQLNSGVNLNSTGDIRLSTPRVTDGVGSVAADNWTFAGTLAASGNLFLKAQRIYPLSAVTFTITTPGNVQFAAPAGSNTAIPLVAGGGITVIAANVDQAGNLFAPLGQITLGNSNASVPTATAPIITQSVTLEPGSLTSVTLADTVVPYGAIQDGTNSWYYNASLSPLMAPPSKALLPSKGITLAGAVVNVDFSTIDVRGGGDLQAMQWIPGPGGSRDTLTTTPSGQTVYALLPAANYPVSAFDIGFNTARSLDGGQTITPGDVYPLAGTQITIAGGGGIPAGTYTLEPAHYATLPGALRVVDDGSNLGRNVPSGTTLPDGTVLVTGNYTRSTAPGTQSAGQQIFAIQTGPVWRSYSEYSFTSANSYFSQQALKQGGVPPRLPMDSGRLAVIAQQSILLQGTALTQPGQDSNGNIGRGSELDISAPELEVVGHAQFVSGNIMAGYVGLDATQLDGGFESILIGGLRRDFTNTAGIVIGTSIIPTAANVVVDTEGDALTAPEILLVAQVGQWSDQKATFSVGSGASAVNVVVDIPVFTPVAGSGSVTIETGSIIETTGIVHTGFGRNYVVASDSQPAVTAASVAAALGGTLDSSGTVISGADLADLPAFWFPNGYQSAATIVPVSANIVSLSYYANGGPPQPGRGALFVASNDPTLVLKGPSATNVSQAPLTIHFAAVTSADANALNLPTLANATVSGSLTLQGGDTSNGGQVTVEAGTTISTNTLTLQATAATNAIVINPATNLYANSVKLTARTIGIGTSPSVASKAGTSLLLAANSTEFANVQALILQALSGPIAVYGNFNPGVNSLTLDSSGLVSGNAQNGVITASQNITLTNTYNTPYSGGLAGSGNTLGLVANEIDIGDVQTITGYSQVNWTASDHVLISNAGQMTLGTGSSDIVNLTVTTPNILVASATNSGFALATWGNVSVADILPRSVAVARPADSAQIGGNLSITASSITIGSTIQAQAGTITLEATRGDVALSAGAYLAAGGYKQSLLDVATYVAGGKVVLQADNGNVKTDPTSTIDVAQPTGGLGYGGEIDVTAPNGSATLNGKLNGWGMLAADGSAVQGLGGSFNLDTQGDLSTISYVNGSGATVIGLDALADTLLTGGMTGSINIHTMTGNLTLDQGHTLRANAITLTADDPTWPTQAQPNLPYNGEVIIAGTIDASGYGGTTLDGTGEAGGTVQLYGANQVFLASTGLINASTTNPNQLGGNVTIGIPWAAQGKILLQYGTQIDVSGGTMGGLTGGTVTFQAPRDGNNDMKIAAVGADGSLVDSHNNPWALDPTQIIINNPRTINFDAFLSFDTGTTATASGLAGGTLGWTGLIDPAGWYNANGSVATSGTWSNVAGWVAAGVSSISISTPFLSLPSGTFTVVDTTGSGANATVTPVMGLTNGNGNVYTVSVGSGLVAGLAVTFAAPAGGVAATGTTVVSSSGAVTININNPGSGYIVPPTQATVSLPGGATLSVTVTKGALQVVGVNVVSLGNDAYDTNSTPQVTFSGSGGRATLTFSLGYGFTGTSSSVGEFSPSTTNYIPLASSGVFATFNPTNFLNQTYNPNPAKSPTTVLADFVGTSTPDYNFFNNILAQVTQGTYGNYGFSNLFTRLTSFESQFGANVVNVQPGVQLVNSSGSITVADNWNLAAGTPGNLQTNAAKVSYFDPAKSYVAFDYRLATPWGSIDPGVLTLRAAGSINLNASISDGFFQQGNYLDPTYVTAVQTYLNTNDSSVIDSSTGPYGYYLNNSTNGSGALPVPTAPYNASGNIVSPTSLNLALADLFPSTLLVCTANCNPSSGGGSSPQPRLITVTAPSSWSYSFTAGANTTSANPNATMSLGAALAGNTGDVTVNNHTSYMQPLGTSSPTTTTIYLPTMVRTGTGNIDISAARDVKLADTLAPGVIYAAGVNTPNAAGDPAYSLTTTNGVSSVVANNPTGFLEPQVLAYGTYATTIAGASGTDGGNGVGYYGPPTLAAFPQAGGDVDIEAQRDIIGNTNTIANKTVQYYQAWLLSSAGVTPAGGSLFGAGVFAPNRTNIASQTAWWIQYGSFQQGILSAGGNVTVIAGRDLIDVSVSLPTTGRVSGGLSASSVPLTTVYGSGNMVVRAGQDILGGSFYEGSGHASIMAGGSVGQNGTISRYAASTLQLPDDPLLAVDTGEITMTSDRSITVAGVINPAELHSQPTNSADPLADQALYMDTYGPDSGVRLVAVTGNLTITGSPTAISDQSNGNGQVAAAASTYPASFEALALNGSLITKSISEILTSQDTRITGVFMPTPGIILSPSDHGMLELLAQDNVDLTFGYPANTPTPTSATAIASAPPHPVISAGPALIDTAFDPYQPNSGHDGAASSAILAHQDDAAAGIDATARIYAVSGNITGTGYYSPSTGYSRIEINRSAEIYAGGNIVDLNIIVQNIQASDVSTIEAGGNVSYTGYSNGGGLQVAGPGFLVVQAGGSIGPFLPTADDIASQAPVQEGIISVGNSGSPVGGAYTRSGNPGGGSVGIYDAVLYGPPVSRFSNPRRNTLLTAAAGTAVGADLDVLFGVKYGADYQAVINTYIDPANASNVNHNYIGELQTFLKNIGKPVSVADPNNLTTADQNAIFAAFNKLPADLQHVFVDQVFFAELKTVAVNAQNGVLDYEPGYAMINTLFPASYGYTANALGGTNGANQLVQTGDLNLLHGTIQTELGGDISILGPGGNILVGGLATEPNPNLKLRNLGILTLGVGAINSFTDQSVEVNASRVLTTQGGDILMWSSNGNIDAGRGSKSILSLPPLQVYFDQNDFASIDLSGLVTGSGIATLQASDEAKKANVLLEAPRGVVDAGSAGIRSSGNLVIVAPVVLNSNNIQVQGTTTGIPVVTAPNIAGLTSASNAGGAAAKSAEAPTGAGGNRDRASIIMVEVIGYGGGDGRTQPAPGDSQTSPSEPPTGAVKQSPNCEGQQTDDCNKPSR